MFIHLESGFCDLLLGICIELIVILMVEVGIDGNCKIVNKIEEGVIWVAIQDKESPYERHCFLQLCNLYIFLIKYKY